MEKNNPLEKKALIAEDNSEKALVTGFTGQDGYYLSNLLLEKGYEVYGMYRRTSADPFQTAGDLIKRVNLVEGDVTDMGSIVRIINEVSPQEIYNLAGQSFVKPSWTQPISTMMINALGPLNFLEAIKAINPKIKFYQASSSEMFGKNDGLPQNEETILSPRSPYAISKIAAHHLVGNYRESYGLFACGGILFNHESPKRGKEFVTRKISHSVAKIKLGKQDFFEIGNLEARRDWGYSKEYVEAMWLMLQQEKPKDYVIGTGKTNSVREFVEEAFKTVDMPISWEGEGLNEVGKYNGRIVVKVNPKFYRPTDVNFLLADPSKAEKELGWKAKTHFKDLARIMVKSDLEILGKNN